jgi:hypothetical protein
MLDADLPRAKRKRDHRQCCAEIERIGTMMETAKACIGPAEGDAVDFVALDNILEYVDDGLRGPVEVLCKLGRPQPLPLPLPLPPTPTPTPTPSDAQHNASRRVGMYEKLLASPIDQATKVKCEFNLAAAKAALAAATAAVARPTANELQEQAFARAQAQATASVRREATESLAAMLRMLEEMKTVVETRNLIFMYD